VIGRSDSAATPAESAVLILSRSRPSPAASSALSVFDPAGTDLISATAPKPAPCRDPGLQLHLLPSTNRSYGEKPE